MKMYSKVLIGFVVLMASCAVALAQADGAGAGAGRAGARLGGVRAKVRQWLRNTDEGKAEIQRFRTALEAVKTDRKTLREAIRKDIAAGKTPAEAVQAHSDQIKGLLAKALPLRIDHREKMLGILKSHINNAGAQIQDRVIQRLTNHFEKMKARIQAAKANHAAPAPAK